MVADLGNSRLKWGQVNAEGRLGATVSLPSDDPEIWSRSWSKGERRLTGASWAVSTVNPPVAERFAQFLSERGVASPSWFRSAADVPVRNTLERAETAGADRALAVLAASSLCPSGRPALVVLCGTAVTVERVSASGLWQGGAIAPGIGLLASAMNRLTAQLPLVSPTADPPPWGSSTCPALEAGVYWGVVGGLRELLTRQAAELDAAPWVLWTGGDAPSLSGSVGWPGSSVVPDLVLLGLARVAFGAEIGQSSEGRS